MLFETQYIKPEVEMSDKKVIFKIKHIYGEYGEEQAIIHGKKQRIIK
jgi:hypothetical protein